MIVNSPNHNFEIKINTEFRQRYTLRLEVKRDSGKRGDQQDVETGQRGEEFNGDSN
jgi:hypothetical protein